MNWNDTKQHIRECVAADIENGYLVRKPHAKRVWRSVLLAPSVREEILVLAWDEGGWADDYEIEQYAHEFADGCSWVIYTHKSEALWHDSNEVSEYEWEILDWIDPNANINERITACVYKATVDAVLNAIEHIRYETEA